MKRLLPLILLISSINVNNIYAEDELIFLDKNKQAPFSGYLFSVEKTSSIRKELIEKDTFKLLNLSLEKSLELERKNNDINQLKINILNEQNNKLATSLYDARETTAWERFFYFTLGVVGTTLAIYGLKTVTK